MTIRSRFSQLQAVALFVAALLAATPLEARQTFQDPDARTGRITGTVVSSHDGRPLSTARVHLVNEQIGSLSSIDGRYLLRDVPAGTYDLAVELLGYGSKTVTGIEVGPGAVVRLDVSLAPEAVALAGIRVEATAERGNTAALLVERRRSGVAVDAIGSEQMDRSPDGDAASALRRVPGLSVVDGRFAYVRGVGERYGATTLNGAPLASPVPDRKAVPLDVIPSSLLESIVTAKSFSPDQPGDQAGGLVQLRTRSFPARETLSLSVSGGWNSASSLGEGLHYSGGELDFLGLDDGTRGLPGIVPRDIPVTRSRFSSQELQAMGRAFGGDWGPTPGSLPPGVGGSVSYGNSLDLFGRRLGILASGTYSRKVSVRDELVERVFSTAGLEEPELDLGGEWTSWTISLGGLVSLAYELSPAHRVTVSGIYNRLAEDEARILEGFSAEENAEQRNTRIRFVAQDLINAQVAGDHVLGGPRGLSLSWRGAYSRAARYEPGTRDVLYQGRDGVFLWENFIQSGSIFHQDLVDAGGSGSLDVGIPFELRSLPATVRLGASTDRKDREAYTRRFRFLPRGVISEEIRILSPNRLLGPEHIAPDLFEIQEATFPADNYDGRFDVSAAYLMVDAEILPRLRLVAGARYERTDQRVEPLALFTGGGAMEPAELISEDVLPAVNLAYELTDGMTLRASASRTLARPQLRELAPFAFADYAGGTLVLGNPSLDLTRITNLDVRWEWYPRPGAVAAVSGFYKEVDEPIEVAVLPTTELIRTWFNADRATNFGVEAELRTGLGFVSDALADLSVNLNVTLVESEVTLGDEAVVFLPATGELPLGQNETSRPLQGQSPYVLNAGVTWADGSGLTATVLFNRFGQRIDAVGGRGTPDIYEEARSQLDVVVEREFGNGLRAKLSAARLLGGETRFTQGGDLLRSWDEGRTVSLSLGWTTP